MFGLGIEQIIFLFFFFSVSGWIGETIMESVVRRRFVNKGFFKGPYVPVHGIGAFMVCGLCTPLKPYPVLVFLVSTAVCTLIEYLAAIVLEKVFFIRGWDYETYPFTKWCHYKRRIALTTSLFFGLVALALVYFYWDLGLWLMNTAGTMPLLVIDVILTAVFLFDAVFTGAKSIRNKLAGIPNKTIGLE
ncbi:MAG: putative ABC transporter permease [Treponema sp.]|jgi:uncharacterized membrane protein|nr:putative ABC transporter permease [Treponema sp.]